MENRYWNRTGAAQAHYDEMEAAGFETAILISTGFFNIPPARRFILSGIVAENIIFWQQSGSNLFMLKISS